MNMLKSLFNSLSMEGTSKRLQPVNEGELTTDILTDQEY